MPKPVTIDRIVWGRDREQKFADRLATDYRIEVASGSNDWRLVASSADRQPYQAGRQEQPVSQRGRLGAEAGASEVKKLVAERARSTRRASPN